MIEEFLKQLDEISADINADIEDVLENKDLSISYLYQACKVGFEDPFLFSDKENALKMSCNWIKVFTDFFQSPMLRQQIMYKTGRIICAIRNPDASKSNRII